MSHQTSITRRRFGRTDLQVTPVGFGGAEIGVLGFDQEHVSALLNRILDLGINVIDTAAMYKVSEELIGKAISHRRDEYVLISKCGTEVEDIDAPKWSAKLVTATIDRALGRLGTDHLDVMLLHSCDLETLQKGDALGALIAARDTGKIRHAGYSGDNEALTWAAGQPDIAVVQTSVNVCDQVNINMGLSVCKSNDVGVMAKRPIANAAWKKLDDQPGGYSNYAKTYTERFAAMGLKAGDFGIEDTGAGWSQLFLRFTLAQDIHTAIIGTTNMKHVESNLAVAALDPLPANLVAKLRDAFASAQRKAGEPWKGQT